MKTFSSIVFIIILFLSCYKEQISDINFLQFVPETLAFDTTFSRFLSVTRACKVKNISRNPLLIKRIYLGGGTSSPFRINVSGIGQSVSNFVVEGKDSFYIFVNITPFFSYQKSPVVVFDSIVVEVSTRKKFIYLTAIALDAVIYKDTFLCNYAISSDLPVLVKGELNIPENCFLKISKGAKIYLWGESSIVFYPGSELYIDGDPGNLVVISGARRDKEWKDIPGQWKAMYLIKPKKVVIKSAVIENGIAGILADGPPQDTIYIINSWIKNFSYAAIYARNSNIKVMNSVIGNSGYYSFFIDASNFKIINSTIANFWGYSSRSTPSLYFENMNVNNNGQIYNSVICGNLQDEVNITNSSGFYVVIKNSFLQSNFVFSKQEFILENVNKIENTEVLFMDVYSGNYELKASSPLIDAGKWEYSDTISHDILGRLRQNLPDVGAYEYNP